MVCAAQPEGLNFTHISVDEGLSSSVVLDIYQDREGFMWFGTDNGLNRYDGYVFKTLPRAPGFANNSVSDIFEDERGRIWTATFRGAGYLDGTTGDYHPVVEGVRAHIITQLDDGHLMVATSGGLRIVDLANENVRSVTTDNGLPSNRIRGLDRDRDGNLWILFPEGLGRFSLSRNRIEAFRSIGSATGGGVWKAFYVDMDDQFWLVSDTHLVRYDVDKGSIVRSWRIHSEAETATESRRTYFVAGGEKGNVWMGTDRGLFILDTARNEPRRYLKAGAQHGLNNNEVRSYFADRQGNVWLGTYGGGVNLYSRYNAKFHHYNYELNASVAGSSNIVSGFAPGENSTLWITTWGDGLKYYDSETDHHEVYPFADGAFANEIFRSVTSGEDGKLWLATDNNGLVRLDPESGAFAHFRKDNSGLSSNDLYYSHYGLGALWVGIGGGSEGLERYTEEGGFEIIQPKSSHTGQDIRYVRIIKDDGERRLFLGTHGMGLWIYDTERATVRHFASTIERKALSNDVIYSLHYDPRGYLWVGTMAGGLNLIHLETNKVIVIDERHGLPNNCINGILPDDGGNLWLSTNKGLSKFHPPEFLFSENVDGARVNERLDRGAFTNYTAEDGLQSNEFKYGAYYRGENGRLYFGGINGYNRFDPREIAKNPIAPEVVITDVRVFDEGAWPDGRSPAMSSDFPGEVPDMRLDYGRNLLTIDYAALNYVQSDKNRYAYYLEGFDSDWRYVGDARRASYTNLPPGEYTFRVKASNNNDVWNETGAALRLTIVPPLWAKIWFQLLVIVGVLSMLFFYYRRRLWAERRKSQLLDAAVGERTRDLATANDRLKKQGAEIERMWERIHDADQEKLRFYTNVSHEFRTPLTLIVGPLEDILEDDAGATERKGMLKIAYRNAVRLLRLINELLDLRSLEAGGSSLRVRQINFGEFFRSIVANFRYQIGLKAISLRIDMAEDIPLWVDPEKVETIFFNLLGNALKFTEREGTIEIFSQIDQDRNMLAVTVRNSGAVIPADRVEAIFERYVKDGAQRAGEGSGIGLSLVKELVDLHRGRIEVGSSKEAGTAFTVWLPTGTGAYRAGELVSDHDYHFQTQCFSPAATEAVMDGETILDTMQTDEDKNTVLVAEDDYDLRIYLRSIFEPKFTVIEAENGRAALELAREHIPDFIISDYMMPELSGLDFCQAIKSNEKTSHIPIIMVTAKATEEDKLSGLEVGIDDYITKPFSSRVLKLKVENILASRQAMRERLRDIGQIYHVNPRNKTETSFYKRLIDTIEANLDNEDFNTNTLAEHMNMSRSQLYRKILAVVNRPASELIRDIRMKNAETRLLQTDEQISTIAYSLGFKSVSHFTKSFAAKHGVPPSKFRNRGMGVE